jgi:hypothetical protein
MYEHRKNIKNKQKEWHRATKPLQLKPDSCMFSVHLTSPYRCCGIKIQIKYLFMYYIYNTAADT